MHIIAAKAVCFHEALQPEFRDYQAQIRRNAAALAAELLGRGWRLVSGGTDNHIVWCDMRAKGITGRKAETTLDRAGITVNRNMIPADPEKPWVASGIRLGTPAVTTRGFRETEMAEVAQLLDRAVTHPDDPAELDAVAADIRRLTARFPLTGGV
jgi:glycine hydroxymethyltransferase